MAPYFDRNGMRCCLLCWRLTHHLVLSSVQKPPQVDVGCLEEVIVKMEADKKGEWGDVMFVPAGALGTGPQEQLPAPAKGKKK